MSSVPIARSTRTAFRLVCLLLLALSGCSRKPPITSDSPISGGSAIPPEAIYVVFPKAFLPDVGYVIVNSAWLRGYYDEFREDLHRGGVVKWEGRFDCNKFAAAYASGAQMRFYRDNFHSWTPAQALAVGEIWYFSARGPHAINVALTERGVVFIEPQSGMEIQLTPGERASIYHCRF